MTILGLRLRLKKIQNNIKAGRDINSILKEVQDMIIVFKDDKKVQVFEKRFELIKKIK